MKYTSHAFSQHKKPWLRAGLGRPLTGWLVLLSLLVAEHVDAIEQERLVVPGLRDRVEIVRDQWGISHIYAENQSDLFFAQGYNAARDRLFQFEIWRRRALGLLAEIQGEKALQHDIGARLLKFRGDIQTEIERINDGEEIINSFVEGVNSYIRLTRKRPELLPIEFRLLGIEPGLWSAEVVLSRHDVQKSGAAKMELRVAELVAKIGADTTEKLFPFPTRPHLKPKPDIELNDLGEEVFAVYQAYQSPPKFTPQDLAMASARNPDASVASLNTGLGSSSDSFQKANSIGSNGWIISGSKTESGSPILANDPHRIIQVPPVRYWTHLVAPGWNVIGEGPPTLPGVTVGHNEHGAWGLTTFRIDQEDLYVYDINPDNANQYRYQGGWEEMQVISDEIPVKGQAAVKVDLKYTRHGPVLYQDSENNRAYALRAAWLDNGSTPYLAASLRMNQAKTWEEFREACAYYGLPALNVMWADKDGNIGWQAAGLTPLRVGWDGVLPVPGDGTYEWAGYAPIKSMPHLFNPPEGHWYTANQYNIPDGYPNIFSFFWADPFRFDRVQEVLQGNQNVSINDSMTLQNDQLSIPARSLVPLLAHAEPENELAAKARQRLLDWNYKMTETSVAAAIYAEWEVQLQKSLFDLMLPSEHLSLVPYLSRVIMIQWLTSPETFFEGDPVLERNNLVAISLHNAVDNLANKLGANIDSWRYGQEQMNHIKFVHPLSDAVNGEYRRKLDIGAFPIGGSENTVNLNFGAPDQKVGPGFRMIIDTKDWDLARAAIATGQSSDPMSPHYDDLLQMWVKGEYFPVYYSREKIESVADKKTYLMPARMTRVGPD